MYHTPTYIVMKWNPHFFTIWFFSIRVGVCFKENVQLQLIGCSRWLLVVEYGSYGPKHQLQPEHQVVSELFENGPFHLQHAKVLV